MPEIDPRFVEAIERLHKAQVQFVVVGGIALNLHGGAHLTKDIDFSFAPEDGNRERLAVTMNEMHAKPLGWPSYNPFSVTASQLSRVRFLNLNAMKKAAGRPKDERHLMELYALKKIIAEEEEA